MKKLYTKKESYDERELSADVLHPHSEELLQRTMVILREKMIGSQRKYGYSNGWSDTGWKEECQTELIRHIEKGDPKDVAIYAMFMIHHSWPTVLT